jgi:hypothetical protein
MSEDTQTVEQIDAEIAKWTAARKAKLEASKQADLETVKKLCKQHGFTATQLRGCLVTRGKGKAEDDGNKTLKAETN